MIMQRNKAIFDYIKASTSFVRLLIFYPKIIIKRKQTETILNYPCLAHFGSTLPSVSASHYIFVLFCAFMWYMLSTKNPLDPSIH